MTVEQLAERLRESSQKRTPEQRIKLLQRAHVLDKEGYYCSEYFSEETVANDHERTTQ